MAEINVSCTPVMVECSICRKKVREGSLKKHMSIHTQPKSTKATKEHPVNSSSTKLDLNDPNILNLFNQRVQRAQQMSADLLPEQLLANEQPQPTASVVSEIEQVQQLSAENYRTMTMEDLQNLYGSVAETIVPYKLVEQVSQPPTTPVVFELAQVQQLQQMGTDIPEQLHANEQVQQLSAELEEQVLEPPTTLVVSDHDYTTMARDLQDFHEPEPQPEPDEVQVSKKKKVVSHGPAKKRKIVPAKNVQRKSKQEVSRRPQYSDTPDPMISFLYKKEKESKLKRKAAKREFEDYIGHYA
jgi:hypothetical protein